MIFKSHNNQGFVLLSALTMVLFVLSLAVLFIYAAGSHQDDETKNYISQKRLLQFERGWKGRFADYEGKPGGRDNNYAVGGFFDDMGQGCGSYCGWHPKMDLSYALTASLLVGAPRRNPNAWYMPECKGDVNWNYYDRPVTSDCFPGTVLKPHDAFAGWRGPYLVMPPGESRDMIPYDKIKDYFGGDNRYFGAEVPFFYSGWGSPFDLHAPWPCFPNLIIRFYTGWPEDVRAIREGGYGTGTVDINHQGTVGSHLCYFFIVKLINWPAELPCENIVARYICPRFGYAFEELVALEGVHCAHDPDGIPDCVTEPFLSANPDGTVQWDDGTGYLYIAQPGSTGGMEMGFYRLRLYYDDDLADPDNLLVMLMELPMVIPWKPQGGYGDDGTIQMQIERCQHIWIDCKR